jgi:hypothetical protein
MTKRRSREQKINDAIVDLINEMFKIAGHDVTYDDVVGRTDNWYEQWTMTESQYDEWITFGKAYLKKNLGMNKGSTEKEMAMVGLMWGLKFKKDDEETSNTDTTVDLADRL